MNKQKLIKLEDHLKRNYTKAQIDEIEVGAKQIVARMNLKVELEPVRVKSD